jgi:hypothetical protein
MTDKGWNVYYHAAEVVVGSAMLNLVHEGDYVKASEKLTSEALRTSLQFIEFADACVNYLMDTYIGKDSLNERTETLEIPEPLNDHDVSIPFFTR